jgi:hypothetical protein
MSHQKITAPLLNLIEIRSEDQIYWQIQYVCFIPVLSTAAVTGCLGEWGLSMRHGHRPPCKKTPAWRPFQLRVHFINSVQSVMWTRAYLSITKYEQLPSSAWRLISNEVWKLVIEGQNCCCSTNLWACSGKLGSMYQYLWTPFVLIRSQNVATWPYLTFNCRQVTSQLRRSTKVQW